MRRRGVVAPKSPKRTDDISICPPRPERGIDCAEVELERRRGFVCGILNRRDDARVVGIDVAERLDDRRACGCALVREAPEEEDVRRESDAMA